MDMDGEAIVGFFRYVKNTYGFLLALASLLKLSGLKTVGLGKYFGSLWMLNSKKLQMQPGKTIT